MRYTLIFKNIPGTQHEWWEDTLHRICPHSKLFWPTFSRIWTEYGEIRSPYSVRIWENADNNNSEYTYFSRSEYTHFSRSEYTHFSRSDTSWFLANFITCELDLPYSFEEIDFQISWAHRSTKHDRDHRNKTKWGPQPIFAQFVNCCIAKKKKKKKKNQIIELNSKRPMNDFVSQMYSKELTLRWNGELKYCRDYLKEYSNV